MSDDPVLEPDRLLGDSPGPLARGRRDPRHGARGRWARLFRPVPPVQWMIDLGLVFVFAVIMIPTSLYDRSGLVISIVMVVALLCARSAPGLALGIAWAGAIAQMALLAQPLTSNSAILVILFATAAYGSTRVFWSGFGSAIAGTIAITTYSLTVLGVTGIDPTATSVLGQTFSIGGAVLFVGFLALLLLALPWTMGALYRSAMRVQRVRQEKVAAEKRAATEEERGRIARDMHDVVAHSLAVVIAQADGARYAAKADPASVTQSLETISSTAREALTDVRVLLTQLRHRQGEGPQPSLHDLESLYVQVRAAGVQLQVHEQAGAPIPPIPAAVQIALYRIVQEALTNAIRHAGGTPVTLHLLWGPGGVGMTVINPLSGRRAISVAPERGQGHGLIGMHERAELVGGFAAAGIEGDYWVVRAQLPIGGNTR